MVSDPWYEPAWEDFDEPDVSDAEIPSDAVMRFAADEDDDDDYYDPYDETWGDPLPEKSYESLYKTPKKRGIPLRPNRWLGPKDIVELSVSLGIRPCILGGNGPTLGAYAKDLAMVLVKESCAVKTRADAMELLAELLGFDGVD